MNYLDLILGVILLLGAIKGYLKGFILEVFSFIAFFAGLYIAIELTIPVASRYFDDSDFFQLITVGVFLALFLVVILCVNLAAKVLKKVVDLTFMGFFDNVLGAIAAVFKWAFIMSVVIWVFDSIGFFLPGSQTEGSLLYPVIERIGPVTFQWISEILPFIKDMIDSLENIGKKQKGVYTFL